MKRLLTKYDNLFEVSFPYSMGWHGKTKKKKFLYMCIFCEVRNRWQKKIEDYFSHMNFWMD